MTTLFKEEIPSDLNKFRLLSLDKSDYKKRLEAIEELGKWKCQQSIDILNRLMKLDKVYIVKENAFRKLQRFGENVKLPKKKKGHIIKDINKKILKVYNSFQSDSYSVIDFKIKFKETYPEAYDVYQYEKDTKFDNWIQSIIKHSPMKRLKNLYQIEISFDLNIEEEEIFSGLISYKGSVGSDDQIKITNKTIYINSERSAIINPKDILENDSNTIHIQIIKSLLFYYTYVGSFVEIKSISLKRVKSKVLQEFNLPNPETKLSQVLDSTFNLGTPIGFTPQQLQSIFESNEKSLALYNAISYLLKAKTTKESSGKFEKLWKAFNSIYRYLGNSNSEIDCHIYLRDYIIANESSLTFSKNKVTNLNKTVLRSKLRLRDLILNDYEKKDLTVSFLAFIFRYSDYRISELLKDTLVYREEFLKDIFSINKVESKFNKLTNITPLYNQCKNDPDGVYIKVVDYLNDNIQKNTTSDMEVLAFICIKYAYYIRNKIFHAEKYDLSFRLIDNKLTDELDWINEILETLILELIQTNQSWVQK